MRRFLIALAAWFALALGFQASASAATFAGTVAITTDPETCISGGTSICFSLVDGLTDGLNLDLELGTPKTLNLFDVSFDPSKDNEVDSTINVSFAFTDPNPATGDVSGDLTAEGENSGSAVSSGDHRSRKVKAHVKKTRRFNSYTNKEEMVLTIEWEDAIQILFDNGSILGVALADLEVLCKDDKCTECFGVIQGTFTLLSEPEYSPTQPVPLPAALPLLATSMMGFGYLGFRRRKAA